MARRSKGEEVLLGLLGIIVIIGFVVYKIMVALFIFIDTEWLLLLGILIFFIILIVLHDYIYLRVNNNKIQELNNFSESSRSNVLMDYQNISANKEILTICDNAVKHFPQRTFLDPDYLRIFEANVLSRDSEFTFINSAFSKIDSTIYITNKAGIVFFKQKAINIETVPSDFFVRTSESIPGIFELVGDGSLQGNTLSDYIMFENLVCSRYRFSSTISRHYCIWKLLKDQSVIYYSSIWENKYGSEFETAESSDMKDLVICYCNILFINHLDRTTISMFTYYLISHDINPSNLKFKEYNEKLYYLINQEIEVRKYQRFEKKLTNSHPLNTELKKKYTINDTDFMNGYQFENFVALLFNHYGYKTTITPSSGDQGIDVIAEKDSERVGIQAKCYSNAVTNSAIQEVSAGIVHYNCSKGIVVTNNNFTKSAIALAESNKIILWNRQKLDEIINEVF
ncbi:MAG: restriction endonuclease [Bacteroidales bacterium]